MPWALKIFLFFAFNGVPSVAALPLVSLDIDGLLFYGLTAAEQAGQPASRRLKFEGEMGLRFYRKTRWVEHFLTVLRDEHFDIGFFSAESRQRNLYLLSEIALPGNSNAAVLAAGRIFSKTDLRDTKELLGEREGAQTAAFKGRFKKPLSIYGRPIEQIVHFDDRTHYAEPGEEDQWVWVVGEASWSMYVLSPYAGWLGKDRERNKLVRAIGILLEARDVALKTGQPLGRILKSWQWKDAEFLPSLSHEERFYARGFRAYSEIEARYPAFFLPLKHHCSQELDDQG